MIEQVKPEAKWVEQKLLSVFIISLFFIMEHVLGGRVTITDGECRFNILQL
jgi:hypothetical protein